MKNIRKQLEILKTVQNETQKTPQETTYSLKKYSVLVIEFSYES
jgi:hypothetical protein